MNQNCTCFIFVKKIILVISLSVPWDEKSWKTTDWLFCREYGRMHQWAKNSPTWTGTQVQNAPTSEQDEPRESRIYKANPVRLPADFSFFQQKLYRTEESSRIYLKCWKKGIYKPEYSIQQGYHSELNGRVSQRSKRSSLVLNQLCKTLKGLL